SWRARLGVPPACSLELSQGLPKKIEFDLLPADLTFQLGNLLARRFYVSRRLLRLRRDRIILSRAPLAPQSFRAARPEARPPIVQILAQDLQLPRQRAYILPRHHPAHRR